MLNSILIQPKALMGCLYLICLALLTHTGIRKLLLWSCLIILCTCPFDVSIFRNIVQFHRNGFRSIKIIPYPFRQSYDIKYHYCPYLVISEPWTLSLGLKFSEKLKNHAWYTRIWCHSSSKAAVLLIHVWSWCNPNLWPNKFKECF